MPDHISVLSSDLTATDRRFLEDPPRLLDFIPDPVSQMPMLAPSLRNASVRLYVRQLYSLLERTQPPVPNSPIREILRRAHLLTNIDLRLKNMHRFIEFSYQRQSRYSEPLEDVSFDFTPYTPAYSSSDAASNSPSQACSSRNNLPGSRPSSSSGIRSCAQACDVPVATARSRDNSLNTNRTIIFVDDAHETEYARDHASAEGTASPSSSIPHNPIHSYVEDLSPAILTSLNERCSFYSASIDQPTVGTDLYPVFYHGHLIDLLDHFSFFSIRDYSLLAQAHAVLPPPAARPSNVQWQNHLRSHVCSDDCQSLIYCFVRLRHRRGVKTVTNAQARHRYLVRVRCSSEARAPPSSNTDAYNARTDAYNVPSSELRNDIIKEWQHEMSTDNQKNGVCGCCSRAIRAVSLKTVDVSTVPFYLLRNDDLPAETLPPRSSYNFHAYDRALLNPKSLSHKQSKEGTITLCKDCCKSLLRTQPAPEMPKFSLANWLYYGHDSLPTSVQDALKDASVFERALISRARASRITFRYCKNSTSTEYGKPSVTSQKYSKGNIIVFPQDSLSLTTVLPPSSDAVRDTMCVLFVGSSQEPLAENIRKLSPCLVRKSRVSELIQFLVAHNPHYALSDDFAGFSAENLDALIDGATATENAGDIVFTPASVEIAHLDTDNNPGEVEVTADYTSRNDADPHDPPVDDKSNILLENVGYTAGDYAPRNYDRMKLSALHHCMNGGAYLESRTASAPENDFENPRLLAWLFPHLDPWGIGGFHDDRRKIKISLEQQLQYLVSLDESPFASDPTFAFVYQNIARKKLLTRDSLFRVQKHQYTHLVEELMATRSDLITKLEAKFEVNSKYQPTDPEEKRLLSILSNLQTLNKKMPGSNGYKRELRNEIRALITRLGAPAFFITINPSDVNNPLVRLICGEDINLEDMSRGEDLSKFLRQKLAAENPHATATYFHRVIETFIHTVLRYDRKEPGLFGRCSGYYGMVEAQGKGTLHCHFLIWIDGHLSPQKLRDKMAASDSFKQRIFDFLESLIKSELPGMTEVAEEMIGTSLAAPVRERGEPNPAVIALPLCAEMSDEDFQNAYTETVTKLVVENHWHRHNQTCWKYLKRGEPKDDAHCRLGIDGSTRAVTMLDEDTQSILLRRLHPRINSHNDVLSFLTQSNNDIQFIGSGEGAKALIYYVTDYITKSSLPTHVGLSALRVAIDKNKKKFEGDHSVGAETVSKSLFVKCANGMLGRMEMSHAQEMSYILGHGDHYTSHEYQKLFLGSFLYTVNQHFHTEEEPARSLSIDGPGSDEGMDENEGDGDEIAVENEDVQALEEDANVSVTIRFEDEGKITTDKQMDDYVFRPTDEQFDSCNLYHFVQQFRKIRIAKSDRNRRSEDSSAPTRARNARGNFQEGHPHCSSHRLSKLTNEHVPVILGPSLPHPDKGLVAKEEWSRAMLTLFKPWRSPADLKRQDESWSDAFERTPFSDEDRTIMRNMLVLHECKDARDSGLYARHLLRSLVSESDADCANEAEQLLFALEMDDALDVISGDMEACNDANEDASYISNKKLVSRALGIQPQDCDTLMTDETDEHSTLRTNEWGKAHLKGLESYMAGLRKRKRQNDDDEDDDHINYSTLGAVRNTRRRKKRQRIHEASTSITSLKDASRVSRHRRAPTQSTDPLTHDGDIAKVVASEFHLDSNPEQLRAFEIIADRVLRGGDQLLMYVGGVGGTGKSHLIKAVVELFTRLGRRRELQLSAPTGAAAVVIEGATIHSLALLPNRKNVKVEALSLIWRDITFLVLDEISMLDASLLAEVSDRISLGKRGEHSSNDTPFGGINVLFTGDFGQLKPVAGSSLFSNRLVNRLSASTAASVNGQQDLLGVMIWRQVTDVVLLCKNQRQADDPDYAALLDRVRSGTCISRILPGGSATDVSILNARILSSMEKSDPHIHATFEDAPVIVGLKDLRDEVNRQRVLEVAQRLGVPVHNYYSQDTRLKQPLEPRFQQLAWGTSSRWTRDALGILPLFHGMKVMITDNLALDNKLVNGADGIVQETDYGIDDAGRRYAKVCYVLVEGSKVQIPGHAYEVVPILPVTSNFKYTLPIPPNFTSRSRSLGPKTISISRSQLPLVPAYSYTHYKSQGRTLTRAVVDLETSASLQGAYVMLSRVKSLQGIAIFRPFKPTRIQQNLSEEQRNEFKRLQQLDEQTKLLYARITEPEDDDLFMT